MYHKTHEQCTNSRPEEMRGEIKAQAIPATQGMKARCRLNRFSGDGFLKQDVVVLAPSLV